MKPSSSLKNQARFFNTLEDRGDHYKKSSSQKEKINQEFNFFGHVPKELQHFFPSVFNLEDSGNQMSYCIKKVDWPDASHYLIDADDQSIHLLLLRLRDFLNLLPSKSIDHSQYVDSFSKNLITKNNSRLKEIQTSEHINHFEKICHHYGHKSLSDFADLLNSAIAQALIAHEPKLYFIHGDLCFSNILFQDNRILLIDPKGGDELEDLYRPIHYDLAKISQSLLGFYDLINLNQFSLTDKYTIDFNIRPVLKKSYDTYLDILTDFNADLRYVRLVESSLLFSMLPFHVDCADKMSAFLIQSLSIYREVA